MSNNDYTKYSREPRVENKPVVDAVAEPEAEPKINAPAEPAVETKIEPEATTPATPATKPGFVYGCSKLNVRSEPKVDASIVCEIEQKSEVEIDLANSTDDFYKVCLASGIEGFCVKTYIIEK